jgi:hypothetical protein
VNFTGFPNPDSWDFCVVLRQATDKSRLRILTVASADESRPAPAGFATETFVSLFSPVPFGSNTLCGFFPCFQRNKK